MTVIIPIKHNVTVTDTCRSDTWVDDWTKCLQSWHFGNRKNGQMYKFEQVWQKTYCNGLQLKQSMSKALALVVCSPPAVVRIQSNGREMKQLLSLHMGSKGWPRCKIQEMICSKDWQSLCWFWQNTQFIAVQSVCSYYPPLKEPRMGR